MSYRKKFKIEGLNAKEPFKDSMNAILSHHLRRVTKRADNYLLTPTDTNLHDLRIALRRFRYLLEAYCSLIKPSRFKKIYQTAVALQNLLGERRDLDVMQLKLVHIFNAAKTPLPAAVAAELKTARTGFDQKIADALPGFLSDKQLHKLIGE